MRFRKVVLMYHSVSGPNWPAAVGSFPIPLSRFQHQVRAARAAGWHFGRLSELRAPVAANTLYVTGDDGTADWARNVLPWCEAEGVPTHTALITGPWQSPPLYPVAHRLQILLALPGRQLPQPDLTPEQWAYIDRVYAYETDPRRRALKGACNVVLDDAAARDLLGPPASDEAALLATRFADPTEYRGWRLAEFGAHTVSHRAFDGQAERYYAEEIAPCAAAIQSRGLLVSGYFTLPMRPRFPATVEQLVPVLRARGYAGVLDGQGEWDGASFIVPRIDAKNVETRLGLPPAPPDEPHESACLAGHEVSR
jgi:peptidoglycan/xylan/chitin deacetylase (PgdA/CDA1 family)